MLAHKIRNFVRVTLGYQNAYGLSKAQAKLNASALLEQDIPVETEFNRALNSPVARKRPGRPSAQGLTKSAAIAALASYFESIGAGVEQSILEAQRWLGIKVSRRVAKVAVAAFKANTSQSAFKLEAEWALISFTSDTRKLPESMARIRKRRTPKYISELG